jgi:hypothetical protein
MLNARLTRAMVALRRAGVTALDLYLRSISISQHLDRLLEREMNGCSLVQSHERRGNLIGVGFVHFAPLKQKLRDRF